MKIQTGFQNRFVEVANSDQLISRVLLILLPLCFFNLKTNFESRLSSWEPVSFYALFFDTSLSHSTLHIIWICYVALAIAALFMIKNSWLFISQALLLIFLTGFEINYGPISNATHMSLIVILFATSASFAVGKRQNTDQFFFFMRALIVLHYFWAGALKFVESGFDWAWSENIVLHLLESNWQGPLTASFILLPPLIIKLFAMSALLIELLSPLALIHRKLYLIFTILWINLHLGIILLSGDHHMFLLNTIAIAASIKWSGTLKSLLKLKD